jgi:hypothetical protein
VSVLRERDPLLDGPGKTWTAWLPVALIESLKRNALIDGYRSVSSYAVDLLAFAIRARETERGTEKPSKK